jgi:hypothetical protein
LGDRLHGLGAGFPDGGIPQAFTQPANVQQSQLAVQPRQPGNVVVQGRRLDTELPGQAAQSERLQAFRIHQVDSSLNDAGLI